MQFLYIICKLHNIPTNFVHQYNKLYFLSEVSLIFLSSDILYYFIIIENKMYSVKTPKKLDLATELQKSNVKRNMNKAQVSVYWVNDRNQQCRKIIGQNRCFCAHSFEQHEMINAQKPYCIVQGCKCSCYQYVPFNDIRCMCRHSYKNHNKLSRMCQMCQKCLGFSTNWSCKCGLRYNLHETVIKFKERAKKVSRPKTNNKQNNSILPYSICTQRNNNISEDHSQLIQNKSQYFCNSPIKSFNKQDNLVDQFQRQNDKYRIQATSYLLNQHKNIIQKQKIIQRINKKYTNLSLDDYYQKGNASQVIESTDNVNQPTCLSLYMKPHNYRYIEIDRLLEKQYKRYHNQISEISHRTTKSPRKF